jgi:MerR family transcriptional regulator/heat shock protein HspR
VVAGAAAGLGFAAGTNLIDSVRIKFYTRCVSTPELIFISVAARMLRMHPQTLRKYERLGLVQPARTIGSMRLYSDAEIARLRLIKILVEEAGVNLAGVQRLLAVAEGLQRIGPLLEEPALGRADTRRRLAREVLRLKEVVGL